MGLGWRSLAKPQATPRIRIRRKAKPVAPQGVGLERVYQGQGFDGERLTAHVLYKVSHGWGPFAKAQPMPILVVRVAKRIGILQEAKSHALVLFGLHRDCQWNLSRQGVVLQLELQPEGRLSMEIHFS